MRAPRPTIAFLKSLPADTFPDSEQRRQIAQGDWRNFEFYRVSHPLIDDARIRFASGGAPDTHRTSSAAAGRPVYELRDRGQGAAWRGAAILDEHGDPWIVYAEKHNRFHKRAADILDKVNRSTYMPTASEYKLRDREDALIADRTWRQRLLMVLLAAVNAALHAPDGCAIAKLPNRELERTACEARVELEHDAPPDGLDGLVEATTMVTIALSFPAKPDSDLQAAALQEFVPFLQAQSSLQPVFGTSGELHIFCTISQAKLVQLIAAANSTEGAATEPTQRQAPVSLHYVGSSYLTEAFVFGKTVRAVCGTWFVPTRDESTDLPICETCESELPIAQAVVDVILGRVSAE